jgi:hypothetical protein
VALLASVVCSGALPVTTAVNLEPAWFVPLLVNHWNNKRNGMTSSFLLHEVNSKCSNPGALLSKWKSASELYRPSDRHLSAKLVPTFANRGCHLFSTTDPYGRILGFLDRSKCDLLRETGMPMWRQHCQRNFWVQYNLFRPRCAGRKRIVLLPVLTIAVTGRVHVKCFSFLLFHFADAQIYASVWYVRFAVC